MANHLIDTQSLYLRKHADNPINWWYWGEEALKLAKSQDKPIFLSIGYSSCHWCTVMESEAFSDLDIAKYLNQNFVAIKVDREERPDIDSIYMTALQMMTGQGGWPLNIFLTPDELVPFYGGTYFPIDAKYGRPGFLQILQSLHDFYHQQKDKLNNLTSEILRNLENNTIVQSAGSTPLTKELLQQGIDKNTQVIARDDYGRPRFPMMPYSNLALQGSVNNEEYQEIITKRGSDLVNGGIYDHVGGGFHRYTVDSTWTVPHFEKMLYDNGLIMEFLANLWSSGVKTPEIEDAVEGTYQWLTREMTSDEGYFYASQDADNFANINEDEPEEGHFYVWSYEQLQGVLSPEELDSFCETFDISELGNFEGNNVLQKKPDKPVTEVIKECFAKLFAVRYGSSSSQLNKFPPARNNHEAKTIPWRGRIPPVTDTKMILSWNCLMISGLVRAYGVLKQEKYLHLAQNTMEFILLNQCQDDRLYRLNYNGKVSVLAQGEDYALLIKALLDLQQHDNDHSEKYLTKAIEIQGQFDAVCGDDGHGGYYNNGLDNSSDLLIREKHYQDNATPSANGIAIANLCRLGLLTDDLKYFDRAEKTLHLFAEVMSSAPVSCPNLFSGLNLFLQGSSVKTNVEIKDKFLEQYLPTAVYQVSGDLPANAIGVVCRQLSCLDPAMSEEELLAQIQNVPMEN